MKKVKKVNIIFLQHHELDSEEKIINKTPFDFDKSGNCLKYNETGYKIFTLKINNEVGKDIAFVNTLNYMLEYCHFSIYSFSFNHQRNYRFW